jgi:hypothetical protein
VSNPKAKKNVAASVRQRLLNLVREQNKDFGLFPDEVWAGKDSIPAKSIPASGRVHPEGCAAV